MSRMQRCFNDLVWWHLTSTTLISVWPRCTPGPWSRPTSTWCSAFDGWYLYEGRNNSWRRPPGRPRNVWLNKVYEDADALLLSMLWRYEIAMSHGAERWSLGLRDDDDGDHDDDEGWLVSRMEVKLIFQGTYRLSGTGIVQYLKIIDVGCNLKQFDVETDRKCIFHFRP